MSSSPCLSSFESCLVLIHTSSLNLLSSGPHIAKHILPSLITQLLSNQNHKTFYKQYSCLAFVMQHTILLFFYLVCSHFTSFTQILDVGVFQGMVVFFLKLLLWYNSQSLYSICILRNSFTVILFLI